MKEGKFQLNSYKGAVLMDLLVYAQQLANQGDTQQQPTVNYLQSLIQQGRSTTQPTNNQPSFLLISGLTLFGVSLLTLGYLWGKRRKEQKIEN